MDCLNVIWNSLCKPSGFKAVEASEKHYLPATREAQTIISRALQELHSQKKPRLSVCVVTSELEARKVSNARLKRAKTLTHALQKIICPVCLQACLCLASFIALHESLQREELNHTRLDRCATNFDARHFMTLQADRGYWKLRSLP